MALAGLQGEGEGMFPNLDKLMKDGQPPANGGMFPRLSNPDPSMIQGMEDGRAAEAAGKIKSVRLTDVKVEVFDFSNPADIARYTQTYKEVFHGLEVGTHLLTSSDRQFVADANGARWIHIMEYHVYELDTRDLVEESTKRKEVADAADEEAMAAWAAGPTVEDLGGVDDIRLQTQLGK
jgi:hypothetical protein